MVIYLLYLSLLGIIVLVFTLAKEKKFNIISTILLTLIIIFFIFNPKGIMSSAVDGAILFFNSVFPTLFPFLVVTGILIQCGGVHIYSKILGPFLCKPLRLPKESSLTLVVSILCGYPLGAKYSCDLYNENHISLTQLQRLLNIASNVGPLFILGTICTAMLKIEGIAPYLLLISNYASCLIMSFLLPKASTIGIHAPSYKSDKKNIGAILKEALDQALATSLSVGSFIVIFSVFNFVIGKLEIFNLLFSKVSTLFNIPLDAIRGVFFGLIEITNGCNILSTCNIGFPLKLSLISFLCSFSGLCIIFQVYSFTYKIKDISMKRYISRKFLQGIISFILTYVLSSIVTLDVSTIAISKSYNFAFMIPLAVLMTLTFLAYKIKNLLHIS
ncbi:MAG: sporulation integral membrane protein YlbJ [Clostridium cadaveris]|uniref:Sporulation integral membrane protein YlbJ n=1 Tax=Clostridium cadaveris TaxID=1529 RepID=A0A316M4G0_9CLOT|nr:sporulation integral membrane protein YlbJ [Clostridium cadaveris]PWL53497.1 MAG: sporulation integral membrane protein YlbJ [Clostridium cadaveris]